MSPPNPPPPTSLLVRAADQNITLSQDESKALAEHIAKKDFSLAPRTSAEFLQLYLNGYTTSEIQKLNPGFKLGIIVAARVEYEWDRHKTEYIQTLMSQTRESVTKSQLEAVRFAADGMTVYHKVLGLAFKKYLQSGRTEDLGDFADSMNIKNYKEFVSLLMTLTGQENQKKVSGEIHHTVGGTGKTVDIGKIDGSDLLRFLEEGKK